MSLFLPHLSISFVIARHLVKMLCTNPDRINSFMWETLLEFLLISDAYVPNYYNNALFEEDWHES